jgi:very-short-patch-repair endonuclease/predicted transcriptional regulator of viral defense system
LWDDDVLREVLAAGLRSDRALARFAERQHGHVTRAQALGAGVGAGAFDGRVKRGYLLREHRGVYRVGHRAPLDFDREMGAVLAAGTRAVAGHLSAAYLWALASRPEGDVHVTGSGRHSRRGIRLHRSPLTRADVTRVHDVPVTRPARTLLDMAHRSPALALERAVADAFRRRLVSRRELEIELARRRPGSAAIRAVLALERGPALTRSEAERRLLALIRAAGLPAPEHNVRILGSEVDMAWREERLVVEVDGFRFHSARDAFERDRLRDARLVAAGFRVLRVTWRRLTAAPYAVVADLAQALAGRSGSTA